MRCYGVLLAFWGREIFEEIGRKAGKVLEIAKEAREKEILEFGRMCLQVEDVLGINKIFKLKCFGYSYSSLYEGGI